MVQRMICGYDEWNGPDMQALDDTIAALGTPALVRLLGAPAAIARWQHNVAVVDVPPSGVIRLAVSLAGQRNAHLRSGKLGDPARASSITVFAPSEGASVALHGAADVVQLLLCQSDAEAMIDVPFACPPMHALQDDAIRAAIMRLLVISTSDGLDDEMMIEQALHTLACQLARHANGHRTRTTGSTPLFRGGLAPAAFRRIEAMVAVALDEAASLSVAEMARATGLSVTHFTRAFRRHTGSTPHKYLVRRRMELAVSLLRDRNMSVAEVAGSVGFATPAHFVASFRAAMGVTPGALGRALGS